MSRFYKDERGAVIFEGLSLVWLLIVLWIATQYGYQMYGSKWSTLWKARAEAWDAAMHCGEDKSANVGDLYGNAEGKVDENSPDSANTNFNDVDGVSPDSPAPSSVPTWFGTSTIQAEHSANWVHPGNGQTFSFSTRYVVTCNEQQRRPAKNNDYVMSLRNVDLKSLAGKTIKRLFKF